MLYTAYGISVKGDPGHDELMHIAEKGPEEFDIAANPGWLVNYVPILQHLPSWFPGTHFKREAQRSREIVFDISDALFKAHKIRAVSTSKSSGRAYGMTDLFLGGRYTNPISRR